MFVKYDSTQSGILQNNLSVKNFGKFRKIDMLVYRTIKKKKKTLNKLITSEQNGTWYHGTQ